MSALVTNTNVNEVIALLEGLEQASPIAVDCETTGLHPYGVDKLRGFSIAFKRPGETCHSFYIPVGYGTIDDLSTSNVRRVCDAIAAVDPVYVYHHAKFDLRFLRQLPRANNDSVYFPVPPVGRFWDTKVVAWLMDENMSSSLKNLAAYLWGEDQKDEQKKVKALIKERGGWDKLTAQDTAEYGAKDAEQTLRLYHHQQAALQEAFQPMLYGNPSPAVARELRVQALLLRMEDRGVMIDSGLLAELLEKASLRCDEIEAQMVERYGVNVNSPKQVGAFLYDELGIEYPGAKVDRDKGDRSHGPEVPPVKPKQRAVNRETLEQLDDPSGVVALILEQRRLRKAISSYLTPLAGLVGDDDRIHPTFWSMGTVTGRFSCSDPNLQTIPRADTLPGVRDIFVAPEGYELWEYDLQAAEMRVVAGMADEQVLIDGLNAGTDMHGLLASQVFGPDYTGIQRRYAKNIGYGFFYGLTSPTTAAKYISGKNGTRTAKKILDGLRAMYPNVVKLMRTESQAAEKQGFIRVHNVRWPGRFRRFITDSARKPYPYTALNARVQGGIGEFMKDIMLEMETVLDRTGARMVLQVHDSLVMEVPVGEGKNVLARLNACARVLCPPGWLPMIFDGKPWEEHE